MGWSCFLFRLTARKRPRRRVVTAARTPSPPLIPPVGYGGYVAGLQYYDGPSILHQLRQGMTLRMVRDRHNPHDGNAIRLLIGRHMLGYVPRGPNVEIARRMDRAEALICRIEHVRSQARLWRQVEIRIESPSPQPQWSEQYDDLDDTMTFEQAGFSDR